MHILVKNKNLFFSKYKVKCAIGKRGIHIKKREGDQITPKGNFKILQILYRKDRIFKLETKIPLLIIKKNMGWCNDSRSKLYNKIVRLPSKYSAEKLYRNDYIYDLILVLNYNLNPIKKNKGSAIFIHVAKNNYKRTEGCIAVSKTNLKKIIKVISKKTIFKIS